MPIKKKKTRLKICQIRQNLEKKNRGPRSFVTNLANAINYCAWVVQASNNNRNKKALIQINFLFLFGKQRFTTN